MLQKRKKAMTVDDLAEIIARTLPTKEDLDAFATKEDLEKFRLHIETRLDRTDHQFDIIDERIEHSILGLRSILANHEGRIASLEDEIGL